MNRRSFLQSTSAAGLAAALKASAQQGAALTGLGQQYAGQPAGTHVPDPGPPVKPNVIWICADQLRAQALSFNGDPNARTPCLDRAEVEGVSFTNHLSGFPLCCPFRAKSTAIYRAKWRGVIMATAVAVRGLSGASRSPRPSDGRHKSIEVRWSVRRE